MNITVKVAKLGMTFDFDSTTLPESSQVYAMTYGLTQAINDAHASIARKNFETDEAYLAAAGDKVAKRVEQIQTGNVPGSRAPADPTAREARKLAAELGGITAAEWELVRAEIAKARKVVAAEPKAPEAAKGQKKAA